MKTCALVYASGKASPSGTPKAVRPKKVNSMRENISTSQRVTDMKQKKIDPEVAETLHKFLP